MTYNIKWKKSGGNGTILYYCGNFVYDDNGLSYILMDEGRLLPAAGGFTYEYFLKDHLGNTRVSFIATGDTLMRTQEDSYYPFGMRQGGLSYSNGVENKYLYNPEKLRFFEPLAFRGSSKNNANQRFAVFRDGKELQEDFGLDWYDYGARFYDAAVGRWFVVDPLAERYLDYSLYAYCADNPLRFYDANGMKIDSTDQAEFDRMQAQVQKRYDKLNNKLQRLEEKGISKKRIEQIRGRVDQLSKTLTDLSSLETSSQLYQLNALNPATNSQGYLSYNAIDRAVVINYVSSTANFVHESTHASQFEAHEVAFPNSNAGSKLIGVDLFDEVAAYKAQYAYSPSSVTGLQSNSQITGINSITPSWVQHIYDPATNTYPYQAQHIGLISINTSSPVQTLRKAYPEIDFGNINPKTTLKQLYPNIIER